MTIGGPPASRTLKVENSGKVILVAGVPTTSAPFPVNGGEFTVNPHGSMAVTIQFTPTVKGKERGELTITSSDPKHRSVTVKVSGTGT